MADSHPLPDDLLSAHRDDELTVAEREAVARLLDESADARSELEDFQALSELIRGLPDEQAPQDLRTTVMERIRREAAPAVAAARAGTPRRSRRFWLIGTLLAGSAAGLLVAVNLWRDRASPSSERGVAMTTSAPRGERLGRETAPGWSDGAVEASEANGVLFRAEESVSESGQASVTNAAVAAGQPPSGAIPGDIFFYPDVTNDGEVVVIEATVVDVQQALNELQFLLLKNSIKTQTTAVDEFRYAAPAVETAEDELGIYVVSDRERINATLEEFRQRKDVFVDLQLAGVLDSSVPLEEQRGRAGGETDDADRVVRRAEEKLGEIGETQPLAQDAEPLWDGPVAPRARMSLPVERFQDRPEPARGFGGPADAATLQDTLGEQENRSAPLAASAPSAESAAPASGERSGDLAGYGYQQIVNVSKGALAKQIQTGRGNATNEFSRQGPGEPKSLSFGANSYYSEPPALQTFSIDAEKEEADTKQQAPGGSQVPRQVRLLVVLEAQDAKSLKAKGDAPPQQPVEAPQPVRAKG